MYMTIAASTLYSLKHEVPEPILQMHSVLKKNKTSDTSVAHLIRARDC